MTLKDWAAKYGMKEEATTPQEIKELFGVSDQRLKDCEILSSVAVSADHFHQTVYAVSLPLTTIPLRASGYRVPMQAEGGHKLLFAALTFTVDKQNKYHDPLQEARTERNKTTYTSVGSREKAEGEKLLEVMRELRKDVEAWMRKNHRKLMEA